jgi:phytoene/squalene synthetase
MVNKYNINQDLIEAFLHSMEMDLDFKSYDDSKYNEYIYGSAEVVGLMCLKVFCDGNDEMYQRLREPACKLGAAFQKVNFLRDIKSDYEERGRVYFPGVDFNQFDKSAKSIIEEYIQKDFDDSQIGIEGLPTSAKLGVRVAYLYYQKLFDKIKALPPETITHQRIRIPNSQKLSLLVGTYFESKLGLG